MLEHRLKTIRRLALLLTLLTFLVVLVSAYLRLSGAGLGCADWPGCYGQVLAGESHARSDLVRILHRFVATLALLLGFYLAWQCQRPTPLRPLAAYAGGLVALMILLTLVGVWSANPHRAWASFVNILGGLGLVALSWRIYLAAHSPRSSSASAASPWRAELPAASSWPLNAGLLALLLALALGALISARWAIAACTTTPACDGIWWPARAGWAALDPFVDIATAAPWGDAGGVALHLLHRYSAVAAMLLLGIAGLQAALADATRRIAGAMLILLSIEFALGSLTVLSGFSLWLAIGHVAAAAMLVAVAMQMRLQLKAG
ncbi:MAG: COX15/CtaA family protein [Burkholderiaceae bacterium]|nr:COX15/CtaA family protein [Burkholderiaceae bacterium]